MRCDKELGSEEVKLMMLLAEQSLGLSRVKAGERLGAFTWMFRLDCATIRRPSDTLKSRRSKRRMGGKIEFVRGASCSLLLVSGLFSIQ